MANDSARKWVEGVIADNRMRIVIRSSMPAEAKDAAHQGIAFRCRHSFYIDLSADILAQNRMVLFVNHVEDPQNFGGIIRAARAFGFSLVVHESRRSAQLTPTVMKASAGIAFQMKFLQVANLVNAASDFRKAGFWLYGLEKSSESSSLYRWEPQAPLVLALGSESDGLTRTLRTKMDGFLHIPMDENVESLNVVQAGSVAMSWVRNALIN